MTSGRISLDSGGQARRADRERGERARRARAAMMQPAAAEVQQRTAGGGAARRRGRAALQIGEYFRLAG